MRLCLQTQKKIIEKNLPVKLQMLKPMKNMIVSNEYPPEEYEK
jgi:hypothetical protein